MGYSKQTHVQVWLQSLRVLNKLFKLVYSPEIF